MRLSNIVGKIAITTTILVGAGMVIYYISIQSENASEALGKPLYAKNCASCHGANLEGQTNWRNVREGGMLLAPPHDKTGHSWHHADELLFSYTKLGGAAALELFGVNGFKSGMPAFSGSLSDTEIWSILAFIKSTWPEEIQKVQKLRSKTE